MVHQADSALDLLEHRLHGGSVSYIADHALHSARAVRNGRDSGVESRLRASTDHDGRTTLGEEGRGGQADPGATTRDEGSPST